MKVEQNKHPAPWKPNKTGGDH